MAARRFIHLGLTNNSAIENTTILRRHADPQFALDKKRNYIQGGQKITHYGIREFVLSIN